MGLKIIGLTGSIGMGKSTVGKMFEAEGIPVYNVDAEIHKFYQRGGRAVDAIREAFPDAIVDDQVDRPKLSKLVVGNEDAIRRLEKIVHPMVGAHRAEFLAEAEKDGHDMVVLDVPLIFETNGESNFDTIVVVSAPAHLQRARVLARDDMTEEKLDTILSRQLPDEHKRQKAHHVIETGCPEEETRMQVKTLIKSLKEEI
ncbi:dephospho-CoA kinase [Sneathiella limimaris]|uniref:dephospho-CoA kinase n=1 Tax=Sneathiella limimaris TaxID=1964213 RepID=UPI00146F8409|nr:dephospho-CoA kinase [Sneathiella limimaris]